MTLWALKLEYHGAPFVGWQRQGELLSVQSVLEAAAARLNANAPVASIVAGRTDAGVHAAGQVAQITALQQTIANQRLALAQAAAAAHQ